MGFKDHFSRQSDAYARYRPRYPQSLFAWLGALSPNLELAVDCGCGSGQASQGLAAVFDRVIAIDPSQSQIEHTTPSPKIDFRVAKAEEIPSPPASVSLVLAAQAAHWFDLPTFYAEVRRVLVDDGVIALIGYEKPRIDRECDAVVDHFHDQVIGPDWPAERLLVDRCYRDFEFPFEAVDFPEFEMERHLTCQEFCRYVATWSAVARQRARTGRDPMPRLVQELEALWGDRSRSVFHGVFGLVGRVSR